MGLNCGDEFRLPLDAERLPDDVNTRGQLKLSRLSHHWSPAKRYLLGAIRGWACDAALITASSSELQCPVLLLHGGFTDTLSIERVRSRYRPIVLGRGGPRAIDTELPHQQHG
jgi:hypothetical protein